MKTGCQGTFVISWSQTDIDGLEAAPVHGLTVGASWSWRGDVVQVEGRSDTLTLDRSQPQDALRMQASAMVHRIVGAALNPCQSDRILLSNRLPSQTDGSFIVTDGAQSYTVTLVNIGNGTQPLLMFLDELPPRNTDLWIVHHTMGARPIQSSNPDGSGVICFTPGTRISTPRGPVLVEQLRIGDLVQTKDNGAQPIEWIGTRHMTGARLFAMPSLRPVRICAGALGVKRPDQELLVSPQHRMLVTGAVARDLFNTSEVLVTAKDLIDGRLIKTEANARSVTYIHLLLPGHNVIWANGVETESFHPANTVLDSISDRDRSGLLALHPDLAFDPFTYGGHIRRNLTGNEAALLAGLV